MPDLLVKPNPTATGEALCVTPESAGWSYIGLKAVSLAAGATYQGVNAGVESVLVVLDGTCAVSSSAGEWSRVGERASVFTGLPHALYLPVGATYTVTAHTHLELAITTCRAEVTFPARHITPADVHVEIRGAGNATRQINHILPPDFPAQRILLVEVFTPSGNWSSYPPHKHDAHAMPLEADLEEIYYYRIDKPEGYAIQKVYTEDGRIDETMTVRDGELVLIPEGYHPVVAPPGYNVYYLNVLAGSARSMAATDDPDYGWVRGTWQTQPQTPRLFG